MADQADVEGVLVGLVGAVVYPGGVGEGSVLGRVCRVYRGFPVGSALAEDLVAGRVNITVFPESGGSVVTTRWGDGDEVPVVRVPGVVVSVVGGVVSVGGVVGAGELVGLVVDGVAVVHRVVEGDDAAGVAAALGGLVRAFREVAVLGSVLVVPGAGSIVARVVADQVVVRQTRRQRRNFRVMCWCPDPITRDDVAGAIDAALSARAFIALPDGLSGRLRFVSSEVFDQTRDAALYRRDLVYSVEYATTQRAVVPAMLFGDARVADARVAGARLGGAGADFVENFSV